MILVYVAGPFTAGHGRTVAQNVYAAELCGLEVARLGAMPVIPHANTSFPDFERVQPYQFWIDGTMALLRVCRAVYLVPTWRESSGARGEVADADARGIPVFDQKTQLECWLVGGPALDYQGRVHQRSVR